MIFDALLNLVPLAPDLLLLFLALALVGSGLTRWKNNLPFHLAWIGLSLIALLLGMWVLTAWGPGEELVLSGSWRVGAGGWGLKLLFVFSALSAVMVSRGYFTTGGDGKTPLRQSGEFYGLLLFSTFGAFTVVSATEMLSLFIGLELATIPLYFLAGWAKREPLSGEAATKYIATGGISTATMLFGFSYLYGFSGGLSLQTLTERVAASPENPLLWIGVLFVFCAVGFKLTLFPFHMWAPDVYEGSSTPVASFLSVSSKAVGLVFLASLVMGPFAAVKERMSFMILLMAAATVLVGNLGALKQTRLRRFMAWSGIAQAGFLMLALSGPNPAARASLAFYLYVYLFANYLTFLVFAVVGRNRGESFESLRGLSAQSPALATALAIAIFSLAGIPPMAGFLGKFGLLRSAALAQHWGWVAFFVLNGVLGLYVYLTVLKAAWLDRVEAGVTPDPLQIDFRSRVAILILSLMTIAAGIMPQWHLLAERLWGAP